MIPWFLTDLFNAFGIYIFFAIYGAIKVFWGIWSVTSALKKARNGNANGANGVKAD